MMDEMPVEVLEMIFSYLPIQDLLLGADLVNRTWHSIVSGELFFRHKKRYHQYLMRPNSEDSKSLVKSFGQNFQTQTGIFLRDPEHPDEHLVRICLQHFLPFLLKSLHQAPRQAKDRDKVRRIRLHPLGLTARGLLALNFPEYESDPICVLAITCLLCQNLTDLMQVMAVLGTPSVMELMYELNLYFLLGERLFKTPRRLHYLMSHAIFLSENRIPVSEGELALTPEQKRVVNFRIDTRSDRVLKVVAFAGTGKTTVLKELCKKNQNLKFLLIVFNKSVKEHAKATFPRNVTPVTANSLSFQYVKMNYGEKKCLSNRSLKADDVKHYMPQRRFAGNFMTRCAQVLETISNFCNSSEPEITLYHVPTHWMRNQEMIPLSSGHCQALYVDAQDVWDQCVMNRRSAFKVDQKMMMKMFQLSRPDLRASQSFHVLLLDECQDLNAAVLDICLNQKGPKIVVGDPHQQIYGFNGANGSMDLISKVGDVEKTFWLTQSFRFGPEIAFAATMILRTMLGEKHKSVFSSKDGVSSISGSPVGAGNSRVKTVYLGRTNSGLFKQMIKMICEKEEERWPKCALQKGMETYFRSLLDLAYFYLNEFANITPKGKYLESYYSSFEKFEKKANDTNDLENLKKIEIVKTHGRQTPKYINSILTCCQGQSPEHPDIEVIFSTVHKFKGLECEKVVLLDDFFFEHLPHSSIIPAGKDGIDEVNLLYVATTRAQKELVMNSTLYHLLFGLAKETFSHVIACSIHEPLHNCVGCSKVNQVIQFEDLQFIVKQNPLSLSDGITFESGNLCGRCASVTSFILNRTLFRQIRSPAEVLNSFGLLIKQLLLGRKAYQPYNAVIQDSRRIVATRAPNNQVDFFPDDDDDFDQLLLELNPVIQ